MKSKKILIVLFTSVMVLCSACGSKPVLSPSNTPKEEKKDKTSKIEDGGNMLFAIGADPQVLNPLYDGEKVTMTINNALFAPLFSKTGKDIKYYLAESVTPSEDFMTYTVKLKDGAKWHDGKPVTADDIVFTMEKILDKTENSVLTEQFIYNNKPVEVKKVDDKTVEFKLPQVTMAFMQNLSKLKPIPKHIFKGEKDIAKSSKNENPIGSGPFKFKEWKKGESIILERFDDYVLGKPHLDSVMYKVIPDPNTAKAALKNEEISANYINDNDMKEFKGNSKFNVFNDYEGKVNAIIFNFNSSLVKDLKVRQAIAYTLDKGELIKAAYSSEKFVKPAKSVFTENTLFYTDEGDIYNEDINKAKDLIKAANASNATLKIAYISGDKAPENQGLLIQEKLKEIGLKVKLMPLERKAFFENISNPKNTDFDMFFNEYDLGREPDSYKQMFMSGKMWNLSRYSNKKVDELFNKGAVEKDEAKREEIYKQVQKEVMKDLVVYTIEYPMATIAVNSKFGGVDEAKMEASYMFEDLSKLYVK